MNKRILAFIPARGGSKGVKNKNIRIINGKPLIAYTIEAAKGVKLFEDIIVSTDSEDIAYVSKKYGADVPFLRPSYLADDNSAVIDTIIYLINEMKNKFNKEYDIIVVLQPTSPLRCEKHIREGINKFIEKNADFLVSVCECEHSPLWCNTLDSEGRMDYFIKEEIKNKNRQELPKYYRLNGALYIGKVESVINNRGFIGKNSYSYIMSNESSIDIDSELDLRIAEVFLKLEKNNIL